MRSRAMWPTRSIGGRSSRRRALASTCSSTTRACSARARNPYSPPTRSRSFARVYDVNVFRPLALVQEALLGSLPRRPFSTSPRMRRSSRTRLGRIHGSSKAALEQLTAILATERPQLRVYSVDPGDMRTQTYQRRSRVRTSLTCPCQRRGVPGLLALIEGITSSSRYRARELASVAA